MLIAQLTQRIHQLKSFLTIGLDTDLHRIPDFLKKEKNPLLAFNKAIVDATKDVCVAYKINTAFYEAQGLMGWEAMAETVKHIGDRHFIIADAKRGDIGNTSSLYAQAFFDQMDFDAITVAPYMGSDSIQPFLAYKNKVVIVLGLTSNMGSQDFQKLQVNNKPLYLEVMQKVATWGDTQQIMFVVGATHPTELKVIRQQFPEHFFLIPGVGTQGGQISEVCQATVNKKGGILINNSRGVIYASADKDFDTKAREVAIKNNAEMAAFFIN